MTKYEENENTEMWREYRMRSQRKKERNTHNSLQVLERSGVKVWCLSSLVRHYRVKDWDFWPSTGKFYNRRTGEKGRGVFNLLKKITNA